VLHVRNLGNHDKAVCKTCRNPRYLLGVGPYGEADPFAEGPGALAQVYRDVPDLSKSDADQFPLRPPDLIMQPAQNIFLGMGVIVLDELRVDPGRFLEHLAVVAFEEKAACVLEHLRLEDQNIGNFRPDDLHQKSRSESTFSRYSP